MGFLFSLFTAAALLFYPGLGPAIPEQIPLFMMLFSSAIFLAVILVHTFAWTPLQKAEQNLTPHLIDLFGRDKHLSIYGTILILFSLVSFGFASTVLMVDPAMQKWVAAGWLLLFGGSIDLLRLLLKKSRTYLDPFAVVGMFTREARKSIRNEKEMELCSWIDALGEVGTKSLEQSSYSLCIESIDELEKVTQNFLESMKSIGHERTDKESQRLGIQDKVSFTLFYIFQRIERIGFRAAEGHSEPVCTKVITSLGKTVLHGAKYDMTLAGFPMHHLGEVAKKAVSMGIPEVGVKASITINEVAREIVAEIDLKYLEIQDVFFAMANYLNEIAKSLFKNDKSLQTATLTKPLIDLKKILEDPRIANHQDTPVIVGNIDRILAEYDALDLVMKGMSPAAPPPPETEEEPPKPPIDG